MAKLIKQARETMSFTDLVIALSKVMPIDVERATSVEISAKCGGFVEIQVDYIAPSGFAAMFVTGDEAEDFK